MASFIGLLKPDRGRLKLFTFFIFLAVLGYIQSMESPPSHIRLVHSFLAVIPSLLVFLELLATPARYVLIPLQSVLASIDYGLRMILGFSVLISYFYLLSCVLISLYGKLVHRRHLRHYVRDLENLV